jgi:hypothetical protein
MHGSLLLCTLLAAGAVGCGHTLAQQKIGLASVGNLNGRVFPASFEGPTLEGEDCGYAQFLSNAVRDALKGSKYDTLVDLEVTTETGLLVHSNCLKVRGKALDSKKLPMAGVAL